LQKREAEDDRLFEYERTHSYVVPANPGFCQVLFWFPENEDPETYNILGNLEKRPVIAWRVRHDEVLAIVPASEPDFGSECWDHQKESRAILEPFADGVFDCAGERWRSLDEWIAQVRVWWKESREKARAK
jgi:hypothetical protein